MTMNETMSSVGNKLDGLKDTMRDKIDMERVKNRLGDVKDSVIAGTKTGINKTASFIKEHPVIAITVAVGIGYLAMRMLRR